jgi:hypothetical protein
LSRNQIREPADPLPAAGIVPNHGHHRDITGTFTPPSFSDSINRSNVPARIYNASLGIQRRIGFGAVLDVACVGTFGRHIGQKSQLNNLPFGTRFLASSLDPTLKAPQAARRLLAPRDTPPFHFSTSPAAPAATRSRYRRSAAMLADSRLALFTPGRKHDL